MQEWSDQETEEGDRDGNPREHGKSFRAYGGQLEAVDSFKYLGRVMTAGDGGDKDGDARTLLEKAREGHGDYTRGGEPPTS